MGHFVKFEIQTNDICIAHFSGIDREQLMTIVHTMFMNRAYEIAGGELGNSKYSKGNRTMRVLFGAFVKYFHFTISVSDVIDGVLKVGIKNNNSFWSGGLLGIKQVKKELDEISNLLMKV